MRESGRDRTEKKRALRLKEIHGTGAWNIPTSSRKKSLGSQHGEDGKGIAACVKTF